MSLRRSCALVLVSSMLAGAAGCGEVDVPVAREGTAPVPDRHPSWRRARVAVGDATSGRISVLDGEDEEITAVVDAPPGDLVASASGQHAILLPRNGGPARLLWSGVTIVDHDDHIHIYKYPPALRPRALGETAPLHIASAEASITILETGVSGESRVLRLDEDGVAKDPEAAVQPVPGSAGAVRAVPLGREIMLVDHAARVTLTGSAGSRALGATCREPGSTGAAPGLVVVDCADGVLRIASSERGSEGAQVATSSIPKGPSERLSSLACGASGEPLVALAPSGRALVALGAGGLRDLALAEPVCDVRVDPGTPTRMVALGASGKLHVVPVGNDAILARNSASRSFDVVAPFSCEAALRPRLAVAPDRAYVTAPAEGALKDVDLLSGAVVTHTIGGTPASIAVLGVDVRNANVAPGAEH